MSAFVVEDETINSIIAYMSADRNNEWFFKNNKLNLENGGREVLGKAMFAMNCRAVDERYGENQAQEFRPLDYKFRIMIPPTIYQALKSLKCFLYQCSEGDIDEMNLYKKLDDYSNQLAWDIVKKLPQYENAKWD